MHLRWRYFVEEGLHFLPWKDTAVTAYLKLGTIILFTVGINVSVMLYYNY